jgi:hypothetical protein
LVFSPHLVKGPQRRLTSFFRVIHWVPDWSLALGEWDGERALLIRYNGSDDPESLGYPIAHGSPVWFVLPAALQAHVLEAVDPVNRRSALDWLGGGAPADWRDPPDPGA